MVEPEVALPMAILKFPGPGYTSIISGFLTRILILGFQEYFPMLRQELNWIVQVLATNRLKWVLPVFDLNIELGFGLSGHVYLG